MEILKIEGSQVYVRLEKSDIELWLPKAMLKQYGVKASEIKVGNKTGSPYKLEF